MVADVLKLGGGKEQDQQGQPLNGDHETNLKV